MRCEIVMGVAFHPEPRGLCGDPRECWAGSKQLPVPHLSISGADSLASAVTLVSSFFFFFFLYMHFFCSSCIWCRFICHVPGSPVKGQKNGSFLFALAWKTAAVFWKQFFTRAFSKFSPELQLVLYTGCQAAGNGQAWALGRKIKVMDKSKTERFLLQPFPKWFFSGAIPWIRTESLSWWIWWMGWQLGCQRVEGMAAVVLLPSTSSAALQCIKDRTAPS